LGRGGRFTFFRRTALLAKEALQLRRRFFL
jgi:hypothetical protein